MEIRRRRRRSRRVGKGTRPSSVSGAYRRRRASKRNEDASGVGSILLPIAVFGVVFYIIAFTSAGDRLTEKALGILPDSCAESAYMSAFSPKPTAAPDEAIVTSKPDVTNDVTASSVKVSLPRLSLNMLQMGVYSTMENAEEQAEALKRMGAAGCIYNDNGNYRVIASAYLNEYDARSVRDRLEREGYACTIYTSACSGAELLITAEPEKLAPIQKAFEIAGSIVERVSAASLEHDTEARSPEDTSLVIRKLRVEVADAAAGIYDAAEKNELLMYLYIFLNDSAEIIRPAETPQEAAEYSSLIKEITVLTALRYASLLKQFCN